MKNVKFLSALALCLGLLIAMSTTAFKSSKKSSSMQYWEYVGTTDPTDQTQYQAASAPSCASGANVVCTILAEEDPLNAGFPKIAGESVESRILAKDESSGDVFVRN